MRGTFRSNRPVKRSVIFLKKEVDCSFVICTEFVVLFRLLPNFKLQMPNGQEPRQGLTQLPRKGAEAWPARCGGDFRSPRKPAGPAFRHLRSSAESPAAAQNQSALKPTPAWAAQKTANCSWN